MLIQAYCQQEREKRCTITAKTNDSTEENETADSNAEQLETSESTDQTADDGMKTPKIEPNSSPIPDDVEMVDASETVTAIKQEPEDEVTSIEMDPLADGSVEENISKSDEKNENVEQPDISTVKIESDENENQTENDNEQNMESSKEPQSEPIDESVKIEESITADKDDPYSKDINIDPRTYCKLGHFHLLLGDYAKGM